AGVPPRLSHATLRLGLLVAAGESASGMIPTRVAALAAGVTQTMFGTKSKLAIGGILVLGLFAAGAAVAAHQGRVAREPQEKSAQPQAVTRPQPASKADNGKETVTYSGRVLDADGRPVAGAELHLGLAWYYLKRPFPSSVSATTGSDGRF